MSDKNKMLYNARYLILPFLVAGCVFALAYGLTAYGAIMDRAKVTLARNQLTAINDAIITYKNQNGAYPPEDSHRLANYLSPTDGSAQLLDPHNHKLTIKDGKYIDPWRGSYYYHLSAHHGLGSYPDGDLASAKRRPFYLWSYGPDHKDDNWGKDPQTPLNRDNIANWDLPASVDILTADSED